MLLTVAALPTKGAIAGPTRWTLTDVGTPPGHPGAFMTPVGLNERGELLGEALTGPLGAQHQIAFTWRNGRFAPLTYRRSSWVDVTALNDRGGVIGDANRAPAGAVVWRAGNATALPTLGGKTTAAAALNDRGQVVGTSATGDGRSHAFLWQNGVMTDLGTLGGSTSRATAINERGQITGTSTTRGGRTHAFLWQSGAMTDLGSLRGVDSYPTAMNDAGEVVGFTASAANPAEPRDAVVWRDGRIVDLGRFGASGASAIAINRRGHILVRPDSVTGGSSVAVLLEGARRFRIGSLGAPAPPGQGDASVVLQLDDRDQVLGYGYTKPRDSRRSFIWQDGTTVVLPTTDGAGPPWGSPVVLNDDGVAAGTAYVRRGGASEQHIVVWRPSR
jgi:probable HAF family extracellular repeat protein